ncbi:MAG: Ca-activated chloride channel [Acidobacteriota bacterium]|jgi:VWFA-related protein|nr:Ca-activated chloride channel [Acidobacteriota bacterium]
MRSGLNKVFHTSTRRALLCVALFAFAVAVSPPPNARVAAQRADTGDDNFVTVDLPASNEVRIENQRGGVEVEVWGEKYLAVAALSNGAPLSPSRESPVSLDRADALLKITVPREATTQRVPSPTRGARTARGARPIRAAPATRVSTAINLLVRVPAHARVSVVTASGAVTVRGVPMSLDAQTVSGDVRLSVAPSADADISARTLYGTISVGAGFGADAGRTLRERYAVRLGAGARLMRLSTVRGNISLESSSEIADVRSDSAPAVERTPRDVPAARGTRATPTQPKESARETNQSANAAEASAPQASRLRRPPVLVGANDATATQRATSAPTPQPGAPVEVSDDEVLTVDTSVVTLNFSVVDRKSGRGLTNLIGGDFKIFENGTEQQITHFEATNAPFDLVLLIDLSGSTAHVTDLIRASARRFVDSVRANDRVGIVAFAAAPQIVSPFTSDKQLLHTRIDAMGAPQGDTKLYDAVNYSLDYIEANSPKNRRRAVVLLTDGLDSALPNVQGEGSALPYAELRRRVQEFDGLFYAVMTDNYEDPQSPQDVQPETYDLAWDRMEELTKEAGGLYYEADKLEDVADIYAHVVEDLGTVYSISYLPTNKARDGSFRRISVRLPRRPEAVARGRSGYYAK